MRRYLLDTNMMDHFLDRRRGVGERVKLAREQGAIIGTCLPVAGKRFFGAEFSGSREINRERLVRGLSRARCWPFERRAAEEYGRIAAELRRIGRPMQQIDIQIAAIARALGHCTLVSSDSDLKAIPGLPVENWAAKASGPGA